MENESPNQWLKLTGRPHGFAALRPRRFTSTYASKE